MLTVEDDMPIIEQLMENIKPLIPVVTEGYQGELNDKNEREGRGTYVYSTGDVYEGQWLANKRHGRGVLRYANGSIYEGQFVAGKRHGQGNYAYSNGDVYDGEFVSDKYHGIGVYISANGNIFEGEDEKMVGWFWLDFVSF